MYFFITFLLHPCLVFFFIMWTCSSLCPSNFHKISIPRILLLLFFANNFLFPRVFVGFSLLSFVNLLPHFFDQYWSLSPKSLSPFFTSLDSSPSNDPNMWWLISNLFLLISFVVKCYSSISMLNRSTLLAKDLNFSSVASIHLYEFQHILDQSYLIVLSSLFASFFDRFSPRLCGSHQFVRIPSNKKNI